jgi:RNA polymerase sigma-70 factor (ECF subfamily)
VGIRGWLNPKDEVDESAEAVPLDLSRASLIDDAYRRFNRPLFRFVRGQFLTHQEAEDVVQDSYARFCAIENPWAVGSMKAFLFTTARNLVIDLKRRKRVRFNYQELESCDDSDEHSSAEPDIDRERQLARLKVVVDALPPRCREVFLLHRYQQRSHREIAEMLGISVHAVEKHVVRALKRCQNAMREP